MFSLVPNSDPASAFHFLLKLHYPALIPGSPPAWYPGPSTDSVEGQAKGETSLKGDVPERVTVEWSAEEVQKWKEAVKDA